MNTTLLITWFCILLSTTWGQDSRTRFRFPTGPSDLNGPSGPSGPSVPSGPSARNVGGASNRDIPPDCALMIVRNRNNNINTIDDTNDINSQVDNLCISYKDVNLAFRTAASRLGLFLPAKPASTKDEESLLADALLQTTKLLRDRYSLSEDEIYNGLPLLDTSVTEIGAWCPTRLSLTQTCITPQRYRSTDGKCNSVGPLATFQGAAMQPFPRFLPPDYSDGVEDARKSTSGRDLPPPRVVSFRVHRDLGYHDHAVTVMFLAWGQLLDHDITFTAESKNPGTNTEPDCCDKPDRNRYCAPLQAPPDDPFFSRYGQQCLSFLRTPPALRPGCKLGPRAQSNELTGSIDASFVYGSSEALERKLRLGAGGLMATLDILPDGLKPLLPLKLEHPDEGCTRPSPDIYCFLAGDNRVNEQLLLAVLHTIFVREHNRIAQQLIILNPHWGDETLYQETRMIVAAMVQVISYSEFLPVLLGPESMRNNDLTILKTGYYSGYEAGLDPTVPSSFATAAFRFGHSLLPSTLERWSNSHRYVGSQRLSGVLRQPFGVYRPGRMDQMVLGMVNQVAQAMDDAVTREVTNHLFRKPGAQFGRDLAAMNIARAREHGVPSYSRFRDFCGLSVPTTWAEMSFLMSNNATVAEYSNIFENVEDVDLWSAGVSERSLPGSLVGPTFNCILGKAFRHLRRADRFWFENPGHPGSFTPAQLNSLRKVRFARVLCDNSDSISTIQAYPLLLPDPSLNPRISCGSQILPSLDLSPWRDLNRSG